MCLKTGFCLEADSHSQEKDSVLCYIGAGTLEIPAAQISTIEGTSDDPGPGAKSRLKEGAPTIEEVIRRAAIEQGLPADFVTSVAKVESGMRPQAISVRGAVGLMQLMPATGADLGVNPQGERDNARGGAKYLRTLLLKYQGDSVLALAAYNAGPNAVSKFGGVPPYEETRRYVVKVLREYERQQKRHTQTGPTERP
ncbi:MAG: lytic transglycosylase domain-containing protein [Acidobacteriaceae bacterium]|nr:lytic transglycosylase domain-containing protein [Acidobacteriaceae bacterium]MBV9497961.1 lytic transglycosylase domain-containing protein [Acidobacteriaceae bacterium]